MQSGLKVKPENKDGFIAALTAASHIAHGHLGWSGMARLMVDCDFDRLLLGSVRGNKRIRRKKMKKAVQQVFIYNVMKHVER